MKSIKQFIKNNFHFGLQNEAHRELWLEAKLKDVTAGWVILDAGAGIARYRRFCQHLKYVAQDFGQYDGQGNGIGLQTVDWTNEHLDIVSDIINIPRPDNSFDAIMCIEVLEHIPDAKAALAEFARLLKPGGRLILTAPFASLTHFAPFHFYSGFNRYFFEKYLADYDFEIIEMAHNGDYYEFLAQELWRLPYMAGQYTKARLWPWDYLVIMLNVFLLKRMSKYDKKSSELLNFGFQLVAIKR